MIGFPSDPEDGEIFQISDNLAYEYDTKAQCWRKLVGFGSVGVATVDQAGLLSKDDFAKIEDIILPTFDTTISSQDCDSKFSEGKIELISSNGDLSISEKLQLHNPDGTIEDNEFVIHNNTIGVDFRINIPNLIEQLEERNNLTYNAVVGDPGDPGDRGDAGEDNVQTGPVGIQGSKGSNAPFTGQIVEDLNANLPTNKAVVDVFNDPDDPTVIKVQIGSIGNPGVGPKTVSWKNKNTPWILGLTALDFNCGVPQKCAPAGNVVYVDLTSILDKLQQRYNDLLNQIKADKEQLVTGVIESIAEVFAQQRQALCCALEEVLTKKTNQEIRNIWSNGRYQAAQAGYAFRVGEEGKEDAVPLVQPPQYPGQFLSGNANGPPNQNIIVNGDTSQNPVQFNCQDCYVQILLDKTNIGAIRSAKIDLPAFDYVATISDCCMFHDAVGGTGVFNILYVGDDGEQKMISINDKGFFPPNVDKEQYIDESLAFRHNGGTVEFYLDVVPGSLGGNFGVTICLQPSTCFQTSACVNPNPIECDNDFFIFGEYPGKSVVHVLGEEEGTITAIFDFFTKTSRLDIYHPAVEDPANLVGTTNSIVGAGALPFLYEDIANKGNQVLVVVTSEEEGAQFTYSMGCSSDITSGGGTGDGPDVSTTAPITVSHLDFYERGWRQGSCCGALVEVGGVLFIVVFRSIGIDCSCGGGEYENTPFISTFEPILGTQPSIAWPTVDGETFFGLPTDKTAMIELGFDKSTSDLIVDKIRNGDVIRKIGDQFFLQAVVFPIL